MPKQKRRHSIHTKINPLMITIGVIVILGVGITAVLIESGQKHLAQPNQAQSIPSLISAKPITPTSTPILPSFSIEGIDQDITHWVTYNGKLSEEAPNSKYVIKIPPTWHIVRSTWGATYYPYGFDRADARIILGAGAHGWSQDAQIIERTFPGGPARYSWIVIDGKVNAFANFNGYIFEIAGIPVRDSTEEIKLKNIFDTMLSSFQLLH